MSVPTTTIISTFTGADVSPLSEGGVWSVVKLSGGTADLRLVSNAVRNQPGQQGASCYVATYGADQEAYFTMVSKWTTDGVGIFTLNNLQAPAATATVDGYLATSYGSSGDIAEMYRIDNGVFTQLGSTLTGITATAGDKFFTRNLSGTLTFSQNNGTGWVTLMTRTDTTYGAGQIGLGCDDTTTISMDDFGGGSIRLTAFTPIHRPFPFKPGSPNISRF